MLTLDTLFAEDIRKNYPDGWAFANFNITIAKDIPSQPNGLVYIKSLFPKILSIHKVILNMISNCY